MQWDIIGKVRAHVVIWSGQAFSGVRKDAHISPIGGLSAEVPFGAHFQSFALVAPYGTRATLISCPGPDWEKNPWRALHVVKPFAFKTPEGKPAVQVPDLDWLHTPNATRVQHDTFEYYPQPDRFEEGTGWTFGRRGDQELKGNVHMIRLEYAPIKTK
jgi:hypothetical protein